MQAPLVHLLHIARGESVSYGRGFVARRETVVGVIPIGYADRIWRGFSDKAKFKTNESVVPVIGAITTNQLLVDVTDVPDVRPGQLVTIIDNNHDSPCGVYALANLGNTICDEIICNIPPYVNYRIS